VTISSADFKEIMSWHVYSVAVVATRCDTAGLVGLTASSVQSVCADPPIISFSISSRSRSADAFLKASHVSVGLLATGSQEVGRRYSDPTARRFLSTDFTVGPFGLPFFSGTVYTLVGQISDSKSIGSSVVLFADVVLAELNCAVRPLVYHRRGFL
jgi:flavin reductase (DIM6/NTAB) family NADH-FMN oxidoreductase RutF